MSDAAHNPEVVMPVDPNNDWYVPEIVRRFWTAREIQDALRAAGFEPQRYDANIVGDDGEPMPLTRSTRWVKGGRALRVPNSPNAEVHPYLAACVVALLAE